MHRGRRRVECRTLDRHRGRRRESDERQREQSARGDDGHGPRDRGTPQGHTLRVVPSEAVVAPFAALAPDAERIGVHLDAEAFAPARRDRYDVGTARAVGTLGAIIEYLLPFLRVGGDAIAWKGRLDAEIAGAKRACATMGGEIVKITPTSELGLGAILPGRSLVVIRKLRETPSRYPRSAAEAKRRPW